MERRKERLTTSSLLVVMLVEQMHLARNMLKMKDLR
jgi:hypothetical protein